jgi:hypothetical protein
MSVSDLPLEVVDRHINLVGWTLNLEAASAIYRELEAWWLEPTLQVELVVPILGVDFCQDDVSFNGGIRLVRLTPGEQLSRWPGKRLEGQESFVAMATHALVIPGWTMTNEDVLRWLAPSDPPEHVPEAERFLESLAIVCDQPSGYVQVLIRPLGWAPGYVADLPVLLTGGLVPDKRSSRLKKAREPLATLRDSEIDELRNVFAATSAADEVALAAARLLSAERRSDAADRIVDLCVGLEALLSDSQGETTYKIAIRAAAMLARAGVAEPSSFIRPMKTVYAHRSAVVHGRGSDKTSIVTISGKDVSTEGLARYVLRRLLSVRTSDPSLTPDAIDRTLLGEALDQFARGHAAKSDDGPDRERQ